MITFISHIRKDSEERVKNVAIIKRYYEQILPACKFIFVEDDKDKNFEYLAADKNTRYIHYYNDGMYNKCKSYNIGLDSTDKDDDIICFLDIDCLVSRENIDKAITQARKDNSINICYNGSCAYFEYKIKETIPLDFNFDLYDYLDKLVDKTRIYTLFRCADYMVPSTQSVGGALLATRDTFINVGRFNPNFIGWGYEDNEIIERAKKFKVPMYYINTNKPILFHLPHEITPHADKSKHEYYEHNHREVSKIINMSLIELKEYIKTW
jgi:predicted glycosyltransferase involved in capsule biosynthesis